MDDKQVEVYTDEDGVWEGAPGYDFWIGCIVGGVFTALLIALTILFL